MSFLRHEKIYQSDVHKRELNCSFSSLTDHRSDESSTGYSFMSCSPAELMSASPVLQSFSLILAAVKPSAVNRNCPSFSLSQPEGSTPARPFNARPFNALIIFAIGRFLRLGSYHCLGASCLRNLLNSFPFSFAKLRNRRAKFLENGVLSNLPGPVPG